MTDPTIFIMVRGGVVQGVRVMGLPLDMDVVVLDFDDQEDEDVTEEEYIWNRTPFNSWEQLEEKTDAVY